MKISKRGIDLIKKYEGLRLKSYLCPAAVWTVGYGHTKTAKEGMVITEAEAEALLRQDLTGFENYVNRLKFTLTQQQFDALVSFIFNIGSGNFQKSTVYRLMKSNVNDPDIYEAWQRWNKAGGKVLVGLVRRREEEADLYFSR